MKLATRLVVLLVLTLAAFVVVDGFLERREEHALVEDAVTEDTGALGRTLSAALADTWRAQGQQPALELLDQIDAADTGCNLRWVWLDADPGDDHAPAVRSPELVQNSLATGALVGVDDNDAARLYAWFPVDTGTARPGALELSRPREVLTRRSARILRRTATHLGVMFLIAVLTVGLLGVRLVGRPLGKLMAKIERVGAGDLSGPLLLRGGDELVALAEGLNDMCEHLADSKRQLLAETAAKIDAIEQTRHLDRLRTVGQLAAGVAHELGTPLNVVGGRAALIVEGGLPPEEVRHSAEVIGAQADRMTGIIRQLLIFARRGTTERRAVDVMEAARQSLDLVRSAAGKRGVALELDPADVGREEDAPVATLCDQSALQQVLTNLLMNSIQASASGGQVRVAVRRERVAPPGATDAAADDYARIDVIDDAAGIPADVLPRVFEPFFTTKDVGEGSGLGLSIVHGIVEDHGGWITVTSEVDHGSRFTLFLPAT